MWVNGTMSFTVCSGAAGRVSSSTPGVKGKMTERDASALCKAWWALITLHVYYSFKSFCHYGHKHSTSSSNFISSEYTAETSVMYSCWLTCLMGPNRLKLSKNRKDDLDGLNMIYHFYLWSCLLILLLDNVVFHHLRDEDASVSAADSEREVLVICD